DYGSSPVGCAPALLNTYPKPSRKLGLIGNVDCRRNVSRSPTTRARAAGRSPRIRAPLVRTACSEMTEGSCNPSRTGPFNRDDWPLGLASKPAVAGPAVSRPQTAHG